ncbi:Fms-interacting protein-domain-containing protein [Syncephalis fuscata]|nr:Fms-interacting protein-domain-containing protein [Syncephalis fuscata]
MASESTAMVQEIPGANLDAAQAHLDRIIDACHKLKGLVDGAYTAELSGTNTHQRVDRERTISLGLGMVAKLKQFNRTAYFNGRDAKAYATTFRDNLEKQHLDLQNLLYEQTHLREEIRKCREREYLYTEVDMYTQEEFMEKASEELCTTSVDAHTLMLNRLQFELQERERLKEQENELLKQRQEFLYENKKRGEELRQVDDQFEAFAKMVQPMVKSLGLDKNNKTETRLIEDSEMNDDGVDGKADEELDDEMHSEHVGTPGYSRNTDVQ